jgi:hypothetical protein
MIELTIMVVVQVGRRALNGYVDAGEHMATLSTWKGRRPPHADDHILIILFQEFNDDGVDWA